MAWHAHKRLVPVQNRSSWKFRIFSNMTITLPFLHRVPQTTLESELMSLTERKNWLGKDQVTNYSHKFFLSAASFSVHYLLRVMHSLVSERARF